MVIWKLLYSKQAQKDAKKILKADLPLKVEKLFEVLSQDQFQNPPLYEKLLGDVITKYQLTTRKSVLE